MFAGSRVYQYFLKITLNSFLILFQYLKHIAKNIEMSEENNRTVVVRHHIIAEEVRTVPKTKEDIEKEKEREKWCCTRIQEARQRNANNTSQCLSEVLCILLESCNQLFSLLFKLFITFILFLNFVVKAEL